MHVESTMPSSLRSDVVRRWNIAGRPTPEQLATLSGRNAGLFRDFMDGRHGFNPHLQLLAMNEALPASDEHVRRFKDAVWRWVREVSGPATQPSLRPVRAKPRVSSGPTALSGPDPLVQARQAKSVEQFNHQLRRLMIQTETSFADIGRRSENLPRSTAHHMVNHDRLPAREEQVRAFVQACGVDGDVQDSWVAAWQEARTRLASGPVALPARPVRRRRRDRILFTVTITTARRGRACTVTAARAGRVAMLALTFCVLTASSVVVF